MVGPSRMRLSWPRAPSLATETSTSEGGDYPPQNPPTHPTATSAYGIHVDSTSRYVRRL
jgi:hypothetical protein